MPLLSLTAFAATHSASRQAATKWKKAGLLVFSADLVDVTASDRKMRAAGLGRFKAAAAEAQPAPATSPRNRQPVAGQPDGKVDEVVAELRAAADAGEIDENIASSFIEQLLAGRFRSKAEAVAVKENALALKHLLAVQKEAGRLVEVELAEGVLFSAARQARDAWQGFPTRIGPLLAADLDVDADRVVEALTVHVQQQLEQLGEPQGNFSPQQ